MADLTPDRLQELRRIAEAATPGRWEIPVANVVQYVATFDPPTVLALLNEIERLRRGREALADVLKAVHERNKHVYTCNHCEFTLCPEGTGLSYRAYRALGGAMDLLDGEKGGGGA